MSSSTLILLAAGGSRIKVDAALRAHPHARVWSLNATRHPREELQFEIHGPWPLNKLNPHVPAIVSPEYPGPLPADAAATAPRIQFPIREASALGEEFFELSHDYMFAFVALLRAGRLPVESLPPGISWSPPSRVVCCGLDSNDPHHFARSRGAHFWIGVLRGLGVEFEPAGDSTLLAGGVDRDFSPPTNLIRPFFYGQPRRLPAEVTSAR